MGLGGTGFTRGSRWSGEPSPGGKEVNTAKALGREFWVEGTASRSQGGWRAGGKGRSQWDQRNKGLWTFPPVTGRVLGRWGQGEELAQVLEGALTAEWRVKGFEGQSWELGHAWRRLFPPSNGHCHLVQGGGRGRGQKQFLVTHSLSWWLDVVCERN